MNGLRLSLSSLTICTLTGVGLTDIAPLSGQTAALPLVLVSQEGRRPLAVAMVDGQEHVALEDLAAAFQLTVREEAGAITVSFRGRTIVLTPRQALASVSGRLVAMPAAPARVGGRWYVPVDFVGRVLPLVYDTRLELRRPSRLVVIGGVRVPRVVVRHEPLGTSARLTVEATPQTTSTVTQQAGRLAITFDADALDAAIPSIQPGPATVVQALRLLDGTTISVELGARFGSYRAATQAAGAASRLVVDLMAAASETTAAPPPPPAAPAGGVPAASAPSPPAPEVALLSRPLAAIRTIAIDPGHGGDDAGTRGAGGTIEKDLTLSVARRLKGVLEGRLGVRVLLTRDDDRAVPIEQRTSIANNNKANLFISLHANASPRPVAGGASVYVAAFASEQPAHTGPAATRVPVLGGRARDLELVPWDLAQTRHLTQSSQLAALLEEQLRTRVALDLRPIDRARFRLLESANMPAVLIEMGYLSNPAEEQVLAGATFQNDFVQAIVDGVVRFRDSKSPSTPSGGDR